MEPNLLEIEGRSYAVCHNDQEIWIGDSSCISPDNSTSFDACELTCAPISITCKNGRTVYTNAVAEQEFELDFLRSSMPSEVLSQIDVLQSHVPFSEDEARDVKTLVGNVHQDTHGELDNIAGMVCHAVASYTELNGAAGETQEQETEFSTSLSSLSHTHTAAAERTELCHLCDIHSCHEMQSLIGGRPVFGTLSACVFCEGAAAPGACNFVDTGAAVRDWPVCDELCKHSDCSVIEKAVAALLLDEKKVGEAELAEYTRKFLYPMCYACTAEDHSQCITKDLVDDDAAAAAAADLVDAAAAAAGMVPVVTAPTRAVYSTVLLQSTRAEEQTQGQGNTPSSRWQSSRWKSLAVVCMGVAFALAALSAFAAVRLPVPPAVVGEGVHREEQTSGLAPRVGLALL
jgi:hypothetical protein